MDRSFLNKPFTFASVIIAIFCVQALVGSVGYLVFKLNWVVLTLMTLSPLCLFPLKKYWSSESSDAFPKNKFLNRAAWLFALLEIGLVINLYLARTNTPPPSPWQLLDWTFFFLFFASTLLLLGLNFLAPSRRTLRLTTIHLLVMYSVTNLIFPLGFGFDGFIHRATEEWIKIHGFINPKLPLYLGQYTWVVWLSHLTTISIKTIDLWLIPILAAFTLPRFVASTLTSVFKIPENYSINLTFVVLLIYFFSLHLTTPFNVLVLFTFLGIFAGLKYFAEPRPELMGLLLLMSLAGLIIHPLLGAPLATFVIMLWLAHHFPKQQTWLLPLYTVGMSILVPVLFMAFLYFTRGIIPNFVNPFTKINVFLNYFREPYWYKHPAAWYWDALYRWEWLIPAIATGLAIFGYYYFKNTRAKIFLWTAVSLTISSFLLRTLVVFPDVHASEQGDYPLRLLKSALMFALPWTMTGLWQIDNWLASCAAKCKNFRLHYIILLFIFATAITVSWYLSYPQWNPKVQFPGYNISTADYEVATWIHDQNSQYNYVVLTNPITAIAALEKYSFAKYFPTKQGELSYYSIPTGGPLYTLYTEMWSEGQKRETMNKAMDLVGAQKAYFVIPSYWTKFNSIVEGAKKSADSWQSFNNGQIYVFVYEQK